MNLHIIALNKRGRITSKRGNMNNKSQDIYLNTLCLAAYAPGDTVKNIIKTVIQAYDDSSKEEKSLVNPINNLYIKILRDIECGDIDLSNKAEISSLLLKFSDDKAVLNDKSLLPEIQNLLSSTATVPESRIRTLLKKVRNQITWIKSSRKLRKMVNINLQAGMTNDTDRQDIILNDLLEAAKDFQHAIVNTGDEETTTAPIDEIDFSQPSTLLKAVTAQKKKRDGVGITFGVQGFNRLFGPRMQAAYGEFLGIAARSHHYKSGILMDITRWICTLNTPPDTGGATPVVLFISMENEIYENLMQWYRTAYVNIYHKDPGAKTDEEIIEFVTREFGKNGFRLVVLRRMGEVYGYKEFVETVENIEKQGCKVVATGIDYIPLMKRCPEDNVYTDARQLQKLGARFHDYANHHEMFIYTGLQMDTEASRVATSGMTNIVRRYGEAHLADCKGLKREFDILFFQEIENNHKGVPYLTWAWNKHRYENNTPTDWKTCACRFTKLGILDDLGKEDRSVADMYTDNSEEDKDSANTPVQVVSVF